MAELEGADRAFAFTSGMAALTAVTRLVGAGQRVLSGDDIYGGTSRLLSSVLPKQGAQRARVHANVLTFVRELTTCPLLLACRHQRDECGHDGPGGCARSHDARREARHHRVAHKPAATVRPFTRMRAMRFVLLARALTCAHCVAAQHHGHPRRGGGGQGGGRARVRGAFPVTMLTHKGLECAASTLPADHPAPAA
jgi:hypothetical protein